MCKPWGVGHFSFKPQPITIWGTNLQIWNFIDAFHTKLSSFWGENCNPNTLHKKTSIFKKRKIENNGVMKKSKDKAQDFHVKDWGWCLQICQSVDYTVRAEESWARSHQSCAVPTCRCWMICLLRCYTIRATAASPAGTNLHNANS